VVRPGDRLQIGPVTFVVEYQLTRAAAAKLRPRPASDDEPIAVELAEPGNDSAEELPIVAAEESDFAVVELLEPGEDAAPTKKRDADPDDAPLPVDEDDIKQIPAGDELRDILSQIEDASQAPRQRKRRKRSE
jgi:hypothetical protein